MSHAPPKWNSLASGFRCGQGGCAPSGEQCPFCQRFERALKYCGKQYCRPGECAHGGCDGSCGPGNGCPCPSCFSRAFDAASQSLATSKESKKAKVFVAFEDDPIIG